MKLIQATDDGAVVTDFVGQYKVPPYAVLSHRWRDGEVLHADLKHVLDKFIPIKTPNVQSDYADVIQQRPQLYFGLLKIMKFILVALENQLTAFWVDTCCIDKSSSAELQESINSMYAWYRDAVVCYAYLDDVDLEENRSVTWDAANPEVSNPSLFNRSGQDIPSEWFERAWTLQELLAPKQVHFYDRNWKLIGSRDDLAELLEHITRIPREVLRKKVDLSTLSIAQRMSWAARRQATRVEDEAYSLLGIFNVSVPMLYGEGRRAFTRLQEEIIKHSVDHSIFAWNPPSWSLSAMGIYVHNILASSPADFANCENIVSRSYVAPSSYQLTNLGLEITLFRCEVFNSFQQKEEVAILNCGPRSDPSKFIAVRLESTWSRYPGSRQFSITPLRRAKSPKVRTLELSLSQIKTAIHPVSLCLVHNSRSTRTKEIFWIRLKSKHLQLESCFPESVWLHSNDSFNFDGKGGKPASTSSYTEIFLDPDSLAYDRCAAFQLRYRNVCVVFCVFLPRLYPFEGPSVAVKVGEHGEQSLRGLCKVLEHDDGRIPFPFDGGSLSLLTRVSRGKIVKFQPTSRSTLGEKFVVYDVFISCDLLDLLNLGRLRTGWSALTRSIKNTWNSAYLHTRIPMVGTVHVAEMVAWAVLLASHLAATDSNDDRAIDEGLESIRHMLKADNPDFDAIKSLFDDIDARLQYLKPNFWHVAMLAMCILVISVLRSFSFIKQIVKYLSNLPGAMLEWLNWKRHPDLKASRSKTLKVGYFDSDGRQIHWTAPTNHGDLRQVVSSYFSRNSVWVTKLVEEMEAVHPNF